MLPTTNNGVQHNPNRFRSARNKSVMQKATDIVSNSLSWSTRNAQRSAYDSYKKNDGCTMKKMSNTNNPASHSISIDTTYLSKNIGFSDSWNKNNSKSTWFKLTKQINRKMLDRPWLLPTIIGSSFFATLTIIFFTMFSHSSSHEQIQATIKQETVPPANHFKNDYNNYGYQDHRTMHKKHDYHGYDSYHGSSDYSDHHYTHGSSRVNSGHDSVESRISMETSVDYVFNLFHNNDANRWNAVSSLSHKYCVDLPHFRLENDEAVSTLKGNIGTLIFDIVKFNPIYTDVTPNNVVITKKGTFTASDNIGSKYSNSRTAATTHCDLVTHLFGIANDLGMLHHATANQHDFDTDSSTFWQTHESDINHKSINQDVSTLFDYANNNQFYEISMELPKLVERHCSHTKNWIENIGYEQSENFYNSLSRAIFTVNNAESSEISENVIGFPVIDSNGDLMQLESGILNFNKHDTASHKDLHYSRCELLDKIVFHGLTMSMNKHIDFMYDAASKDDYYGFEILSDLLDTEYCDIVNHKLTDEARNNLGLHLWSLMKDIQSGKFYLMDNDLSNDVSDSSNEYVITTDGGIMHSKVATNELKLKKSQIIHCSLIKEIIKRGIKHHSGNFDYYHQNMNSNNMNEFEHRYDDSGLSNEFLNEMKEMRSDNIKHSMSNNIQLVKDAGAIINHLQSGQETEFIKLLDYLLDQYHSEWFGYMSNNDIAHKRSIKLMIEQTVHSIIMGHVSISSQYDPANDMTILRKHENELEIIHQNDFKNLSNEMLENLERLPLLDEIFRQIIAKQQ